MSKLIIQGTDNMIILDPIQGAPGPNEVTTSTTTNITGLLKGADSLVAAAVGDVDYQKPITLTTTGSSGAATFIDDVLNIPQYTGGGGGGVSSVGLSAPAEFTVTCSPVTSSGTLTFSKNTQAANLVYAGPASGSAAVPTFRDIVPSDIPILNQNTTGSAGSVAASGITGTISLTSQVSGILPSNEGGTGVNNSHNLTISGTATISGSNTGDQIVPANTPGTSHQFFTSYNSTTGNFTEAQPAFTDISGTASAAQIDSNLLKGEVGKGFDNGSSVIATGQAPGFIICPYAGTITGWTLIGNTSGSIVVDVWKASTGNIPTVSNSIVASAPPTMTSAQQATSSTLTGWTTSVAAGDVFAFSVTSAATVSHVDLVLLITKS